MIRIGLLGAAKIAPLAMVKPVSRRDDCTIVAVASRDEARARAFADQHGITDTEPDYDSLIARPDIDLIYNGLPPHRHADLSIAAMRAGKAVLCEKPFAMNADEAQAMVTASQETGQILLEAFHYRFHPAFQAALDTIQSGQIGKIYHIDAAFSVAIPYSEGELRHTPEVGGGALMDLGCYPLHWVRTLIGETPTPVSANANLGRPGVDLRTTASFTFPGGATATIQASMAPHIKFKAFFDVQGDRGRLRMNNPIHPHHGYTISGTALEQVGAKQDSSDSTYDHQLAHVVDVIKNAADPMTGGADAIENMAVIDAIYRRVGMSPRGT
jgi:predicted dehydrogenase